MIQYLINPKASSPKFRIIKAITNKINVQLWMF